MTVDPGTERSALIDTLIESLSLNIELLQMIIDRAPADLRRAPAWDTLVSRLALVRDDRRWLLEVQHRERGVVLQ